MVGALMPDRQLETESGTRPANGVRLFVSPRDSDGRIPRHVRTARRSEPHRNRSVDPGEAGGGRMLALAGASARYVPPRQAAAPSFSNAKRRGQFSLVEVMLLRVHRHATAVSINRPASGQRPAVAARYCPIVSDGCAGPPWPSMRIDQALGAPRRGRPRERLPGALAGTLGALSDCRRLPRAIWC